MKVGYLARRIEQARQEKVNLIFFQIDSPGGLDSAADSIADQIASISGHEDGGLHRRPGPRRRRPSAPGLPRHRLQENGPDGRDPPDHRGTQQPSQDLSEAQVQVLTKKAAFLAGKRGHPEAVARAMVDPDTEIVEARDLQTGAVRLLLREEAEADRAGSRASRSARSRGINLVLTGDEAAAFGLGQVVGNEEELKGLVRSARQADPGGRARPGSIRWSRF